MGRPLGATLPGAPQWGALAGASHGAMPHAAHPVPAGPCEEGSAGQTRLVISLVAEKSLHVNQKSL